jgi:hypothetical protein
MLLIIIVFLVLVIPPFIATIFNIVQAGYVLCNENAETKFFKICNIYTVIGGLIKTGYVILDLPVYTKPVNLSSSTFLSLHEPIFRENLPPIAFIMLLAIAAYFFLSYYKEKYPPILRQLMLTFLYAGMTVSIFWAIQLCKNINIIVILLLLYPFNFILLSVLLIKKEYKSMRFISFLLLIPVIAVIVGVSMIFGRDATVLSDAFTKTSDWTFSKEVSPPPIDGHYLCTAAVKGHKKLVKPIRYGKRHGHTIIVNRQLQIANAFEELISEKAPKIHKFIRSNYDKHGYPLSKHINSPAAADAVYILMKPLEWFFLCTLYIFSKKPEERISKQYI